MHIIWAWHKSPTTRLNTPPTRVQNVQINHQVQKLCNNHPLSVKFTIRLCIFFAKRGLYRKPSVFRCKPYQAIIGRESNRELETNFIALAAQQGWFAKLQPSYITLKDRHLASSNWASVGKVHKESWYQYNIRTQPIVVDFVSTVENNSLFV